MKLSSLNINGFRCFKDSGKIPIHSLTVFIGENDSGKSTVRDATEILLDNKNPTKEDYFHDDENNVCGEVIIEGVLEGYGTAYQESHKKYLNDAKLQIKKTFNQADGMKCFVYMPCYVDTRLNNLESAKAETLKQILNDYELPAQSTNPERITTIAEYLDSNDLSMNPEWKEVKFSEIQELLPILQIYSSSDYGNPTNLIRTTLNTAYRSHFYNEEELKPDFVSLRSTIEDDLNRRIQSSLSDRLKQYLPGLVEVAGDFNVNFEQGLQFNGFRVNTGSGLQSIDQRGEGTKKKLFLALLEWDKEVSDSIQTRSVLKIYDEPDANLHYDAQRNLFKVIRSSVENEDTQAMVVTHSLTMVDRAPAGSINHVIHENGESTIDYLKGEEDEEIRDFLHQISNLGGIRNSSIFYEKCFVLVEGESEDNALPLLYKKYFERSMGEDGIVLVNLQSNGAWKNFLKLLNKNKQNCTVMLLDTDTQTEGSAKLTTRRLEGIGYSASFLSSNVFFIGTKEFEDAIPTSMLVSALNEHYPKQSGDEWSTEEIDMLKAESDKFSVALEKMVNENLDPDNSEYCRKSELSRRVAYFMEKSHVEGIDSLKNLFLKISEIID